MTAGWSTLFTLRRGITLVALVAAWCALWGSVSAANVLSGTAVALVALLVGVGGSGRGGVRIVPLARFVWLVAVDLVASTATVVREVLTPTDYTEEGIVGVELPRVYRDHLLLLYVAITVTPGTAVIAAESDGSMLYLHVLHCDRRAEVEAHVHRLAQLATDALPAPSDRSEVRS